MDGIMSSKLFATRQGTIFLGIAAAVIAAIALIVYLNSYRNSVNNNASSPVLVAATLIQEGTPGKVIGSTKLYNTLNIAKSDIKTGAVVDPKTLTGMVALTDIYAGQQLTAADFGPGTGLTQELSRDQRAVVIPLGSPQQLGGQIGAGSHVDIYVTITRGSRSVVELLFQDVYVLGASGENVTLRANPRQAAQLIFASQNAQPWLVLRPTVATTLSKPPVIGSLKGGG